METGNRADEEDVTCVSSVYLINVSQVLNLCDIGAGGKVFSPNVVWLDLRHQSV